MIPVADSIQPDARPGPGAFLEWAGWTSGAAALTVILTIPRSFLVVKLVFLALFVVAQGAALLHARRVRIYPSVLAFYGLVAAIGAGWSIVGMINGGAPGGIVDSVRLWVAWSIAYAAIVILLRNGDALRSFHWAMVASGILVSLLNVVGLLDAWWQTGWIGAGVREELDLAVGFHDGYFRIMSHNIGSLFFIVPYLAAIQWRRDCAFRNGPLTKLSLLLSLVVAILSGRRALWLGVAAVPLIIEALARVSGSVEQLKRKARIATAFLALLGASAVLIFSVARTVRDADAGAAGYLSSAFSAEDERSVQSAYLLQKFVQYPVMGTGFGVGAGYVRNEERPWIYELTYHQILFNFGVVGSALLLALFAAYLALASSVIRRGGRDAGTAFCLMTGFFAFLLGAYSNPYLGSFDFLVVIATLPLLSTFAERQGTGAKAPGGVPV